MRHAIDKPTPFITFTTSVLLLMASGLFCASTADAAVKAMHAKPSSVTLSPGRSVTIQVQGTDLMRVSSAGVFLRNRQPVSEILVSYRPISNNAAEIRLVTRQAGLRGPFLLVLNQGNRPATRVPVTIKVAAPQTGSGAGTPQQRTTRGVSETGVPAGSAGVSRSAPQATSSAVTVQRQSSTQVPTPTAAGQAGGQAMLDTNWLRLNWVKLNNDAEVVHGALNITFGYSGNPSQVCVGLMGPAQTTPSCYGDVEQKAVNGLRYDVLEAAAQSGYEPPDGKYAIWIQLKDFARASNTVVSRKVAVSSSLELVGRPAVQSYTVRVGNPHPLASTDRIHCMGIGVGAPGLEHYANQDERLAAGGGFTALKVMPNVGWPNIQDLAVECSNGKSTNLSALGFAKRADCPSGYELNGVNARIAGTTVPNAGVTIGTGVDANSLRSITSITCAQRRTQGRLKAEVPLQSDNGGASQSASCRGDDVAVKLIEHLTPGGIVSALELMCVPQITRFYEE